MEERILGSLTNDKEIMLLILFIIQNFKDDVSRDQIHEIALLGDSANYFDVNSNIDSLLKLDIIACNDDVFSLTEKGEEAISLLSNDLPLHIRNRAIINATKVLIKSRIEKDTPCEIVETDEGFNFVCKGLENGKTAFEVMINVDTIEQAKILKANYKRDPFKIFRTIIDVLSESGAKSDNN